MRNDSRAGIDTTGERMSSAHAQSAVTSVEFDRLAPAVFDEIMARRFSCRAYVNEEVPQAVIESALATAQRSASWTNSQVWQVDILSGAARERLSREILQAESTRPVVSDLPLPTRYEGVYQERRREVGYALYGSLGIERSDYPARHRQMLENYRFFGAPHLAVITTHESLGVYGVLDCGIYLSALMSALQSWGVSSIPMASTAYYSDVVRETLAIPDGRLVVCALAFGYADHAHAANQFRATRADIATAAIWHD